MNAQVHLGLICPGGSRSSPVQAHRVVAEARALIGTSYQHQGRNEFGVDCMGLVTLACRRCSLELPPTRTDYRQIPGPELMEWVQAHCTPTCDRPLGALLLFRFDRQQTPRHVGMATEIGVVHCNAVLGRVVEHRVRAQWVRWLHSAWLLPGVQYL